MGKSNVRVRYMKKTVKFDVVFDPFDQLPREVWGWLIKYMANFTCEGCGAHDNLHSHHLDCDSTNNCLTNGVCVCRICHSKVHSAIATEVKLTGFTTFTGIRTWDS